MLRPGHSLPVKRTGTNFTEGWKLGGPRGRSGRVVNFSPPPGFETRPPSLYLVAIPAVTGLVYV
jgi:hypothetical protein